MVGLQLDKGRSDLEADLGEHARLDGAEAEHAHGDVLLLRCHLHRHGASGDGECCHDDRCEHGERRKSGLRPLLEW